MHTNQTYNSLIIENVGKIQFPASLNNTIEKIDWAKQSWMSIGLPAFSSIFCVSNDILYFQEDASGNVSLKLSEFTGEVLANTTLVSEEKDQDSYVVSFKLLFFKGLLCESEMKELKAIPYKEYSEGFEKFKTETEKKIKIINSFWYRRVYKPYSFLVKGAALVFIAPVEFITKIMYKSFEAMLFIDES